MTIKRKILRVSKGQIAPELIERTDIGILDASGQTITNYYNSKYGALKSAPGTKRVISWTGLKKCKMQKIKLADLTEGFIVFNGTDKTISVYNNQAELISNVLSVSWLTETNVNNVVLAQNQDLILIVTGDSPIIQINIANLSNISASVYSIPMTDILKSSSISLPAADPNVFLWYQVQFPTNVTSLGIEVGDYLIRIVTNHQVNPNTIISPINLFRYDGIVGGVAQWTLVSYTPANDDVLRDTKYNLLWKYHNSAWTLAENTEDKKYASVKWYNSAVSGVVTIKEYQDDVLFVLTAPNGISPETYAKSILTGITFDGTDALGIMQIQSITGTVSGQNFAVTSLTGETLVSFDKNYSANDPATGFIIKYSEQPVFSGDYPYTSGNPTSYTNYPISILFYQQRLIIGGTAYNPSQMIFSETGKYNSFKDEYYSSSAFQLVIGSTEKEQIKRILLNQGIQIFTTNNEWLMGDGIITRSSGFIRNSSIGTNGVEPVIAANGTTLFVPKNGKGLIGFTYNYQSASYMTPYISLFTDLLDKEIVDLCQKRGLSSTDDTLLYISMSDGSLVIGNYLQEHEIQAFCKRSSSLAKYKQTIQVDENIVMLVDRIGITGLEIVDESLYTEAAVYSFSYNASTGVISDISAAISYNGTKVNVYDGNRKYVGNYLVSNGQILLPEGSRPASISEIGRNISSEFVSNPQNIGQETKTKYKSITAIRLALTTESNPEYLKVENKSASWVKDNLAEYRRLIRPTRNAQFHITNDIYPVEILSMEIEIEA